MEIEIKAEPICLINTNSCNGNNLTTYNATKQSNNKQENNEKIEKFEAQIKTTVQFPINKKLQMRKKLQASNIKCGEIYLSTVTNRYIYVCSICPSETFIKGCFAFANHYKKYHPSFYKPDRDPLELTENDSYKDLACFSAWIKRLNNGSKFIEKEVALKQLKALNEHKKTFETEKEVALKQLKALNEHKETSVTISCYKCHKKFHSEYKFLDHVNTHSGKNFLVCMYCDEKFEKLEDLKKHQQKHTGDKKYECKICSEKFLSYDSKQHHKRQHHEP